MAVSKMQKWVILMAHQQKDPLLKAVQALQQFEPVDMHDLSIQETHAVSHVQETIESLDMQLARIEKMQAYLAPYVTKRKKTRDSYHFDELEALASQIEKRDVLNKAELLAKQTDAIGKTLAKLAEDEAIVRKWAALPYTEQMQTQLQHIGVLVGTVPQQEDNALIQAIQDRTDCFVVELFQQQGEHGILVYFDKKDKQVVQESLETQHFNVYHYPFENLPTEQLALIEANRTNYLAKQKAVYEKASLLAKYYTDLLLQEELVYNERERYKAQLLLTNSQHLCALTGWLEEEKSETLQTQLAQLLEKNSYVCLKDNATVTDEKEIPIVLKNHPLVEPFESLTEMYGLPKYSEIDPTPYFAPFYAIFFGMMVADVGYGLLVLLGTLAAMKWLPLTKNTRKSMRLFHILAYPIIIWGFIFGSFFSFDLPFRLLSASVDIITILVLSLVFGILQLMFGLLINTRIHLKNKAYADAFASGLGWLGIFIGVLLIVAGSLLQDNLMNTVGSWVAIVNAAGIVISSTLGAKNKLVGFASGLYNLYGISGYVGDLASYTRLMALCVAGASIGASFNLIIGLLPEVFRFSVGIILLILLQTLNFLLALLGAYVHSIRLQFVEFFGKFYEGGGRQLKPLKTYEKHIDIKEK